MKVNPGESQNYLVVTYWGNELEEHDFDIYLDDKKAGTVFALKLTTQPELFPNYFFYF